MRKRMVISIITLIIIIASVILTKNYLLPSYVPQYVSAQTNTPATGPFKGITHKDTDLRFTSEVNKLSNQNGISLPTKDNIGDKIRNIQDQLKFINMKNLPPQVQGILHQIQELPKQSLNGLKNACLQLCSRL